MKPTFLAWSSDVGDVTGLGSFGHVTDATAAFSRTFSGAASASLLITRGLEHWSVEFAPVQGGRLQPGVYEGAVRAISRDATHPGLDIGYRSGCNSLTGRFVIREVAFASDSGVSRLNATFEQHCGGAAPAIRGEIRFNALTP
jgi:hypothetical protein